MIMSFSVISFYNASIDDEVTKVDCHVSEDVETQRAVDRLFEAAKSSPEKSPVTEWRFLARFDDRGE